MKNFTDTYIKGLKSLPKRYEQYEGNGFGIRIAPTGVKTWIYRYKINGITDKLTLGHYPQLSLANAKQRFMAFSAVRKEGINPKDHIEQTKLKENNTVKKLVHDWYANYAKKNRKQPLQIKQQIDADIVPLLGEMALEQIQTRDIANALDKIVARGARTHQTINGPLTVNALPRAVNRMQERIGIPHWTIHDARRSFATHLGETLRIDPVVIEKCLGHKMPKIMATYNKNEMLPERKAALDRWGQCIENVTMCDNVIPFGQAV